MRINSVAMKLGFIPSVMSLQHLAKHRFNGRMPLKNCNGVKGNTPSQIIYKRMGNYHPLISKKYNNRINMSTHI